MIDHGLCLLSLDGGGLRVLSTLWLLRDLMRKIDPLSPPKPCDCFDLIGGSGFGGIAALLLGRLEMTAEECIAHFGELASAVLKPKGWTARMFTWDTDLFDSRAMEVAFKKILSSKGMDGDTPLLDEGLQCRTFVCVMPDFPFSKVLRTYGDHPVKVAVWEAARATSALPTLFRPITIGKLVQSFQCRASSVSSVWREAQKIWPQFSMEDDLKCLLSIELGSKVVPAVLKDRKDVCDMFDRLAAETKEASTDFVLANHWLILGFLSDPKYFRFSTDVELEDLGMNEFEEMERVIAATESYLCSPGVDERLTRCAKAIANSRGWTRTVVVDGE